MFKHKKVGYRLGERSVPVPIMGHSNEVVIPVKLAERMYPKLKSNKPFDKRIYDKLEFLFEHTVVPKKK
jgi:hypothetical protein